MTVSKRNYTASDEQHITTKPAAKEKNHLMCASQAEEPLASIRGRKPDRTRGLQAQV